MIETITIVSAVLLIGYCFVGSFQECRECGGYNAHVGLCDDCLERLVEAKLAKDEAKTQARLREWAERTQP